MVPFLRAGHILCLIVCTTVPTDLRQDAKSKLKGGERVAKVGGLRPLTVYCDNR